MKSLIPVVTFVGVHLTLESVLSLDIGSYDGERFGFFKNDNKLKRRAHGVVYECDVFQRTDCGRKVTDLCDVKETAAFTQKLYRLMMGEATFGVGNGARKIEIENIESGVTIGVDEDPTERGVYTNEGEAIEALAETLSEFKVWRDCIEHVTVTEYYITSEQWEGETEDELEPVDGTFEYVHMGAGLSEQVQKYVEDTACYRVKPEFVDMLIPYGDASETYTLDDFDTVIYEIQESEKFTYREARERLLAMLETV